MVRLVGIAGGTGAGKSTLCTRLMDTYPNRVGLVQLDDYFKPDADVPLLNGFENWDHPESLFLDKLALDLHRLREGMAVVINTKNLRLNPDYAVTGKRMPVRFDAKPVMLVEGFLVLWDKRIRNLLDDSFFLDVPHSTRYARRVHFKNSEYERLVLHEMQNTYLEPTKQYANHVLDVSELSADEVYKMVVRELAVYLI